MFKKFQVICILVLSSFSLFSSCDVSSSTTDEHKNRLDSLANTKTSLSFHSLVLGEKFNKKAVNEMGLKVDNSSYKSDSISYELERASIDSEDYWNVSDRVLVYTTKDNTIYQIKILKTHSFMKADNDIADIYFEKYDKSLATRDKRPNYTYWTWNWENQSITMKVRNYEPERNDIEIVYLDKVIQKVHNEEVSKEKSKEEQNKKEKREQTKNYI